MEIDFRIGAGEGGVAVVKGTGAGTKSCIAHRLGEVQAVNFGSCEARSAATFERGDHFALGGAGEVEAEVARGGAGEEIGQGWGGSGEFGEIDARIFGGDAIGGRSGEFGVERAIDIPAEKLGFGIGNFEMAAAYNQVSMKMMEHDGRKSEFIHRKVARRAEIFGE